MYQMSRSSSSRRTLRIFAGVGVFALVGGIYIGPVSAAEEPTLTLALDGRSIAATGADFPANAEITLRTTFTASDDSTPVSAAFTHRAVSGETDEQDDQDSAADENDSSEEQDGQGDEGLSADEAEEADQEADDLAAEGTEESDEDAAADTASEADSSGSTVEAKPFDKVSSDPEASEDPTDDTSADEPTTDEPATDEPTTDEPTTDEPATDEPTTDEPTTDEPATDEPTTDEPASESPTENAPIETGDDDSNLVETSVTSDADGAFTASIAIPEGFVGKATVTALGHRSTDGSSEEPASEEPASEEPASEEPASEEPASEEPATTGEVALAADPELKDRAEQITSTYENGTTELQYDYIEDIGDGNGYTAGRAGFTSGTHDLLLLVQNYTKTVPDNPLAQYIDALEAVDGSDSHDGLDGIEAAFKEAAQDPKFIQAQDDLVNELYFQPAMKNAETAGVKTALGQAIFYDTEIQHGGGDGNGSEGVLKATIADMGTVNGNEKEWLTAYLQNRLQALYKMYPGMGDEGKSSSESRINGLQSLIDAGKWDLSLPLQWEAYGSNFEATGSGVSGEATATKAQADNADETDSDASDA